MDIDQYIRERVENQISWYSSKSKFNKIIYISIRIIEIIASVLIPLIVAFMPNNDVNKIVTASLGIVITIASGILSILKVNENWIQYRTIAEKLQNEKYLYLTKSGIYSDNNNNHSVFVENIEKLISKENLDWAQYTQKKNKEVQKNV